MLRESAQVQSKSKIQEIQDSFYRAVIAMHCRNQLSKVQNIQRTKAVYRPELTKLIKMSIFSIQTNKRPMVPFFPTGNPSPVAKASWKWLTRANSGSSPSFRGTMMEIQMIGRSMKINLRPQPMYQGLAPQQMASTILN